MFIEVQEDDSHRGLAQQIEIGVYGLWRYCIKLDVHLALMSHDNVPHGVGERDIAVDIGGG